MFPHTHTNEWHLTPKLINTMNYKDEKTIALNNALQEIQNNLRDWRDNDPDDNDAYWYRLIDGIADLTNIHPQ